MITLIQETATLEELVAEINRFEAIISEWDESQRCVVVGLKRAIEALHKAALTRFIQSLKQESMPALRHAVADELVYAVLLYHELVKPPKPPLLARIQAALDEIRPSLKSHHGDVELVAIKPPDTVEVKLVGTCSSCPASNLTLSQGVEQAIKTYCPEITQVIAVNDNSSLTSLSEPSKESSWVKVTTVEQIPQSQILTVKIANQPLILYRQGEKVFCYRDRCSHLGYTLSLGKMEGAIITCPVHEFQYKLDTGECLTAPDVSLQSCEVRVKGNQVFIRSSSS